LALVTLFFALKRCPQKYRPLAYKKKIASFENMSSDFLNVNRKNCCFDLCIILLYWYLQEKKVKVPGLTFDQLRDNERKQDPFQSAPFAMKQ